MLKRRDVKQVAYVPDAAHPYLIRQAQSDPEIADVVPTTEEEGVALVSGAGLGGQRAVLLIQLNANSFRALGSRETSGSRRRRARADGSRALAHAAQPG